MSPLTHSFLSITSLLILPGLLALSLWSYSPKTIESAPIAAPPLNDSTECTKAFVKELEFDFVPTLKCQFIRPGIVTYSLPLFADIDGDGATEIVVALEHSPDGFAVIDPENCEIEYLVDVGGDVQLKDGGPVLGDVDRDGFVDVFITADSRIQRWEYNPGLDNMELIWQTPRNVSRAERAHLDIWDMDQNGEPEIIPNQGQMVNGVTGYVYPGDLPLLDTEGKGLFAFSADADPEPAPAGQGNVELVYGTNLFRYDFINEEWIGIKGLNLFGWGIFANVSLADMDLDGDLDAVITRWDNGEALIWDMQNSEEVLGGRIWNYPGELGSRMNIANMDEDEFPEMVMTSKEKVFAIDDIVTSNGFGNNNIIWLDNTSDESGHTQLTSFDFDGNGSYEIIYRDETNVRIFSGLGTGVPTGGYPSGPQVLLDSGPNSCFSFTGMEYPTIGDVDNDNEAEIVASCIGGISIYESGSLPWGNASRVWNTQAFNVTCVNQDGSIPAIPVENYKIYNNFLAQINLNPKEDTLFVRIPDATITIDSLLNDCREQVSLQIQICNQGADILPANTPVAIYWEDPRQQASTAFHTFLINDSIEVSQCLDFTTDFFKVPSLNVNIFAVVNDDGQQSLPYIMDSQENGGDFPFNEIDECDYTNNLDNLNILLGTDNSQAIEIEICEGDSYVIDEIEYQDEGLYSHTTTNVSGCDSLIFLDLRVLPHKQAGEYVALCEGESILFKGEILDETGVYIDTTTSIDTGCDSIFTLILDVFESQSTSLEIFLCEGDTYELNGESYQSAGTYQQLFETVNGCDSTVNITIDLIRPPINVITREICEGESYRVGDRDFSDTGVFTEVETASNGCDSIINLELVVHPRIEESLSVTICEGEKYFYNGDLLDDPGFYSNTYTSVNGCDSIVELELIKLPSPSQDITVIICEESSYEFNGQNLSEEGQFQFRFPAANGCDSIVNVIVDKLEPTTTFIEYRICEGDRFVIGEDQFDQPGVYQGVLPATNGCDSIVNYDLQVYDVFDSLMTAEICEGENYFFQGTFYDRTGQYTKVFQSETGCDSIFNLDLTVLPISYIQLDTVLCAGDLFIFGGEEILESGNYTQFDKNTFGCDSITFLNVEILPSFGLRAEGGPICLGDEVQLNAYGGSLYYEWTPAQGLSCTDCPNPIASPTETTDYTVRSVGCLGKPLEATARVEVYEIPKVDLGEDMEIQYGESISIFPEITDFYEGEIEWMQNGEPMDCPEGCLEDMTPLEDVTYSVIVSNPLGCADEDTVNIKVTVECIVENFFIPNTISPNGDGLNDYFYIESYNGARLEYLRIYARWGELLFETKDFGDFWDGTYKGQTAQTGDVFVVLMKAFCPNEMGIEYEGNLTVIK